MSDWQIGDLAVCVQRGAIPCPHLPIGTHKGGRLPTGPVRVAAISPAVWETGGSSYVGKPCGCVVLRFDSGHAGLAQRFRKIRPDEHQACEPEFVTLLKRSKRKVSA